MMNRERMILIAEKYELIAATLRDAVNYLFPQEKKVNKTKEVREVVKKSRWSAQRRKNHSRMMKQRWRAKNKLENG